MSCSSIHGDFHFECFEEKYEFGKHLWYFQHCPGFVVVKFIWDFTPVYALVGFSPVYGLGPKRGMQAEGI